MICKGLALGLTALGLAAGGALAEDEYLIRAEAENGTLLGRAQIAAAGTSPGWSRTATAWRSR